MDSSPVNHDIVITSNQELLETPVLTNHINSGTLSGVMEKTTPQTWSTSITVDDSDIKGIHPWKNLIVKGLSGITTNSISIGSTYTIGGFVRRTINIPAFPERSGYIGTHVTDVTKLRCTNLSKGASGSFNYNYQSDKQSNPNKYCIIDSEENPNINGSFWYNTDDGNATSNTTGLMSIEIEEVI
jgi:hypothetical protein